MKVALLAVILLVSLIEKGVSTGHGGVTDFEVSISVNYTPPSTFHFIAPYYRAASPLSLTCEVNGISGEGVFYEWRSTCVGNCFAARQTSKTVATRYLHSYDSGVHTCIVYDGLGCSGNASVTVHVTGAGIYVTAGHKALPNNGLIVAGANNRVSEFRCLSGSSSPYVGQLLGPNGEDLTHIDTDHFLVHRGGSYDPGLVHIRRLAPLASDEQGVYTCRIPNERGVAVDVNVGIYLQNFAGPPMIESLVYGVNDQGFYVIKCITSGSPPSTVSWTRNGAAINPNNWMYKPTQALVNRTGTVYENLLLVDGSFEDAVGNYSCTVENSLGISETVNRAIKSLEITGHSKPIIVGLTGTINCSTLLNVSKLEWFISGIKDLSESKEGTKFITLSLTPQTSAWNGTSVTCRATTYSGEIYEESIDIIVKELENAIRIEGASNPWVAGRSNYSLTCVVTADIAPEVKWRDGSNNQITNTNGTGNGVFVSEPVVSGRTTRLTLHFNSLRTSHGASYSCLSIITVPSSIQVAIRDVIIKIPPPTVRVLRQPDRAQFFTTESVDLICLSNIDLAVDTPISVSMTWSGPSRNRIQSNGRVTVLGDRGVFLEHDSTLQFSSLLSSDTGSYTCSSVASSNSRFIVASSSTSAINAINAVLKTTISISYTPPDQYPKYSPPYYRAASSVTFRCSAQGASGSVRYRWSSTCRSCFASSSSSSTISESILRSRDAGTHTCTVTDSSGNSGSNSTQMNIYGAGIYVSRAGYRYAGRQAAQPDNTYINIDSGSRSYSSYTRFSLYCCSNSTASNVGSFIDPYGHIRTSNFNELRIVRYGTGQSYTGCIYLYGYDRYGSLSYTSGVYTCNIPDASGQSLSINFALYDQGHRPSPHIYRFQRVSSSSALSFTCVTRYAPPTEITWTKNGVGLIIDGNTTRMTHTITNRRSTYYDNTLSIYGDPDEMAGRYSCSYGNRYSSQVTSSSVTIRGIQLSGQSSNLAIGRSTSFTCSSDLAPTRVQWYRNGSLVANSYGSQGRVYLSSVSTDDEGALYTCKTLSPYGSQERNVTVHVQVPSSWASIEITNTTKGDALHEHKYELVCTVQPTAGLRIAPDVNWYSVDGSVIETGERISVNKTYSNSNTVITLTLTFSSVLNGDGGVYLCRAQITVPWMTTQPSVKQDSVNMVVTTQAIFQLKMGPLSHCSNWEVSKAEDLERSVKERIEPAIRQRCNNCNFRSSLIHSGEFSCQTTTSDIIYRAVINGTSDLRTATQLLGYIEDWRRNKRTLLYHKFRLRLSQHCPLQIKSFDEEECMISGTPGGPGGGKEQDGKQNKGDGDLLLGGGSCYRFQACDNGSDTITGSGDY